MGNTVFLCLRCGCVVNHWGEYHEVEDCIAALRDRIAKLEAQLNKLSSEFPKIELKEK